MSRSLRLVPLGGLGEIGMNCLCVEQGDQMLMIDCGVTFPQREPGIDVIHPDFDALGDRLDRLKALVITHGHEDHIGAVPYLLQRRDVPIYGPDYALALIRERLREHDLPNEPRLVVTRPGETHEIAGIGVEAIRVTHSIPDATALALRTAVGIVVHSGDFKVDPTPTDGEHFDADRLRALGDAGVRLLLSDSTNVDNEGTSGSEAVVSDALRARIAQATGRLVIATFASNVHRLRALLMHCRDLDKRVLLLGRSMQTHRRVAAELEMLERDLPVFVNIDQAMQVPRDRLVVLATGTQGEPRAALAKLAHQAYPQLRLEPGDEVVLSSRVIPGRELEVHGVLDAFERLGLRVWQRHDEPELHVSGHACQQEQRRMLELTRPRSFMPVHGTLRHLKKHAELAREVGVQHGLVALNGDCVEVTEAEVRVVDQWPVGRVLIQGGHAVSPRALRDRNLMAEVGVAIMALSVSKDGRVLSRPTLLTRGVWSEDDEAARRDELITAAELALSELSPRADDEALRQALCGVVRRRLAAQLGYRPLVYAMIQRTST